MVVDVEPRLRETTERLVVHIEEVVPTIRCTDAYPMTSVAALARCRSLLRSMLNHDRDGLYDLMGADLRMLFEFFVFALYVLHGGDEEMEHLRRQELRYRNLIARGAGWDLTLAERDPRGGDKFSFEKMCEAVGELMTASGSQHDDVLSYGYEVLYRGESYLNTHPSLQGLGLYMHEDKAGQTSPARPPERDRDRLVSNPSRGGARRPFSARRLRAYRPRYDRSRPNR